MTNNTPKNRWELVREKLLADIRLGKLPPGTKLASERVLAKELGVSHPTVHKAMSDLASAGVVTRHVGRGTFVTDAARRRTGAVALYFGKWANPFEDPILYRVCAGIAGACSDRGLDLFFHTPQDIRFVSPSEYVRAITDRGCDGVICLGHVRSEVVEKVVEHLPAVVAACPAIGDWAPRLIADQAAAVAAATRHLAALGRKRIALLGMAETGYSTPDAIVKEYRSALSEARLEYDESIVSFADPATPAECRWSTSPQSQYWFDRRVITGSPRPDAAVAINPGLARNCYELAFAEEIGIGTDLAIVGVMETHWTDHVRPGCTTVDFLSEALGREALAMLEEAIDGSIGPETVRRGATPLVVRESCGSPAASRTAPLGGAVEAVR